MYLSRELGGKFAVSKLLDMALLRSLVSSRVNLSGRFSGEIYLWSVLEALCCHQEDEVFLHGGITGNPVPPFACQFAPVETQSHILAVADEEGSLRLLNVQKQATSSLVKELVAHSNAIFDISWKPDGKHIMTGSGDTTIGEWDVVRGESVAMYKSHTGSVKTIDVKQDEPSMFVSGSRDGSIFVWDTRCSSRGSKHMPVNHIRMAHKHIRASPPSNKKQRHSRHSITVTKNRCELQYGVTSVLFHGLNKVASCGAADGVVKLWDLRRTYSICKNEPPSSWHSFSPTGDLGRPFGFTSLVSDPWQNSLFASCTNDTIYQYSTSLLNCGPVGAFGGHKNSTFYVKSAISPEGRYLLSGSSNGQAFIWHVDQPDQPPIVLDGHNKEVTAVCWSPRLTEVVTCSDNNDLRIWRIKKNRGEEQEYVGGAVLYDGEGHRNVRELIKRKSARETPLTFRKKRVPSTTENRTPQIKLSDCTTGTTAVHQCSTSTPGSGTGGSVSRGVKRRATGSTVPPRKVLQLHNYFSRVDSK